MVIEISWTTGGIAIKFGADIHGPQRMNCNNFDPLTFRLAPSSGQKINLSNILAYDQKPAKRMAFPADSHFPQA